MNHARFSVQADSQYHFDGEEPFCTSDTLSVAGIPVAMERFVLGLAAELVAQTHGPYTVADELARLAQQYHRKSQP